MPLLRSAHPLGLLSEVVDIARSFEHLASSLALPLARLEVLPLRPRSAEAVEEEAFACSQRCRPGTSRLRYGGREVVRQHSDVDSLVEADCGREKQVTRKV